MSGGAMTITLRELIRQRIATAVTQLGGGVVEPEQADQSLAQSQVSGQQFFALIRVGVEPEPTPEGARVLPVDIWTYGPPDGNYTDIDAVNAQIVASINWTTFQEPVTALYGDQGIADLATGLAALPYDEPGLLGQTWLCTYAGTAYPDTRDPDLQSNVRPLRFRLAALRWRSYAPYTPLAALGNYMQKRFGSAVQTDPSRWVPSDAAPAVYWRFAGMAQVDEELTFDSRWLLYPVQGHVVAPSPDQRDFWLQQVTLALASTRPYGLPTDAGDYIKVSVQRADTRADPITEGQIALAVRWLQVDIDGSYQEPPLNHVVLESSPENPQLSVP